MQEQKSQNYFKVKNYYKMPLKEIEEYIVKMQNWLFTYKDHPNTAKVRFALGVACKARDLKGDKRAEEVIDLLT
jgi:hypothetical protein